MSGDGARHVLPPIGTTIVLCASPQEDETGMTQNNGTIRCSFASTLVHYSAWSDRSPVLASKSAPLLSRTTVVSSPPDLLAKCNGVRASSLSLACEREKRGGLVVVWLGAGLVFSEHQNKNRRASADHHVHLSPALSVHPSLSHNCMVHSGGDILLFFCGHGREQRQACHTQNEPKSTRTASKAESEKRQI